MKSQAAFLFFELLFIASCQTHSFDIGCSPAFDTTGGAKARLPAWLELPGTLLK